METPDPGSDLSSAPDINIFVLETGRLPRLGDSIPPWRYRGWLVYQVQLADQHPDLHMAAPTIHRAERSIVVRTRGRSMEGIAGAQLAQQVD